MKIIASCVNIGEILRDGKIYTVPIFQRSFEWKEQQITDFWEDIINIYEGRGSEYF